MEERSRIIQSGEPLWSRYMHRKGAALGLPIAGNFELTSNCNFNCRMCYIHRENQPDALSAEDWISIGKTAKDAGMIFLLLTGGEPFLRKDFKKIYEAFINMGLLISINTNASLIDDDMFNFLIQNPPVRMNISLYGCSDDVYKKLCGNSSCEIVMYNIKRIHDAGIGVKINASITPYNVSEIEHIYAFGKELGVPVQATTYMYPPVRIDNGSIGTSPARFDPEEAAAQMLKCREQYMTPDQLRKSFSEKIESDMDCRECIEGENMRCRAGRTSFWITWDGRMLPCGMFPHDGYKIADLGFGNAWEMVKAYTKTIRMPKECSGCLHKKQCNVCAASVIAETGNSTIKPEYICRLTETIERLTMNKYGEIVATKE